MGEEDDNGVITAVVLITALCGHTTRITRRNEDTGAVIYLNASAPYLHGEPWVVVQSVLTRIPYHRHASRWQRVVPDPGSSRQYSRFLCV